MCCTSKRGKFKHLTLFSFSAFFPCDFFEDIEFSQQAILSDQFHISLIENFILSNLVPKPAEVAFRRIKRRVQSEQRSFENWRKCPDAAQSISAEENKPVGGGSQGRGPG